MLIAPKSSEGMIDLQRAREFVAQQSSSRSSGLHSNRTTPNIENNFNHVEAIRSIDHNVMSSSYSNGDYQSQKNSDSRLFEGNHLQYSESITSVTNSGDFSSGINPMQQKDSNVEQAIQKSYQPNASVSGTISNLNYGSHSLQDKHTSKQQLPDTTASTTQVNDHNNSAEDNKTNEALVLERDKRLHQNSNTDSNKRTKRDEIGGAIPTSKVSSLCLPIIDSLMRHQDFGWIFSDPVVPDELGELKKFNQFISQSIFISYS